MLPCRAGTMIPVMPALAEGFAARHLLVPQQHHGGGPLRGLHHEVRHVVAAEPAALRVDDLLGGEIERHARLAAAPAAMPAALTCWAASQLCGSPCTCTTTSCASVSLGRSSHVASASTRHEQRRSPPAPTARHCRGAAGRGSGCMSGGSLQRAARCRPRSRACRAATRRNRGTPSRCCGELARRMRRGSAPISSRASSQFTPAPRVAATSGTGATPQMTRSLLRARNRRVSTAVEDSSSSRAISSVGEAAEDLQHQGLAILERQFHDGVPQREELVVGFHGHGPWHGFRRHHPAPPAPGACARRAGRARAAR